MLLTLYKATLCLLLFLLLYLSARHLLLAMLRTRSIRSRLTSARRIRNPLWQKTPAVQRAVRHLEDLMAATRRIRSVRAWLMLSLILLLTGMVLGVWLFRSLRGVAGLGTMLGASPYILLRLGLVSRRLKTRLEFLPAVEVFYQTALLALKPNMRMVLHEALQENRLRYPIKSSFEQLDRCLASGTGLQDALRVFRLELGHVWAEYFSNMLWMALEEGVDITPSLKELIDDMRRAQLYDQKARNRLLEIRVASFTPVFFLALFVGVNLKLNYDSSVQAYFMDPAGRNMLLQAVLLQFGALLMGLYLSMRRM